MIIKDRLNECFLKWCRASIYRKPRETIETSDGRHFLLWRKEKPPCEWLIVWVSPERLGCSSMICMCICLVWHTYHSPLDSGKNSKNSWAKFSCLDVLVSWPWLLGIVSSVMTLLCVVRVVYGIVLLIKKISHVALRHTGRLWWIYTICILF